MLLGQGIGNRVRPRAVALQAFAFATLADRVFRHLVLGVLFLVCQVRFVRALDEWSVKWENAVNERENFVEDGK